MERFELKCLMAASIISGTDVQDVEGAVSLAEHLMRESAETEPGLSAQGLGEPTPLSEILSSEAIKNFLWALDKGYYFTSLASIRDSDFVKAMRVAIAPIPDAISASKA